MKCIDKINVSKKTVIIRCDLNVSISDGIILSDDKIKRSAKTINYVLDNGGRCIVISHLGRIKSSDDKSKNSLGLVIDTLNKYVNNKIKFISSLDFNEIRGKVSACPFGSGILLENTRFYDLDNKRESNCDLSLAREYASLGNIFVNDAFATIHRKHASNYGISKYLPCYAGFLMKEELDNLNLLDKPKRPFAVILGGSKVSDKIELLNSLLKKVDKIFIGGAMANTFLKASDIDVGSSKVEDDMIDICKNLLVKYKDKIMLPIDFIGRESFEDKEGKCVYITDISNDFIGMDIGNQTIDMVVNEFLDVSCCFFNGPVGVYEFEHYRNGTEKLLKLVSKLDTSIIGGGDIISCAKECNMLDEFTYVSTGGGATLAYLATKKQPGLSNFR